MPISVVVGGQYGSEGKGKAALHLARESNARFVVRVGGPNSGHTGTDETKRPFALRQLPASALHRNSTIILPAGSLIDPDILEYEIKLLGINPDQLVIDERASVVLEHHRLAEAQGGLVGSIGSTGSGTGAAVQERISRTGSHILAAAHPFLSDYVVPNTASILRSGLRQGHRAIIEGTQGCGLSLWHSSHYPNVTSRDTTAATFVAETGAAPHDVDQVVMVIRSYPIRVHGTSGPLPNELSWDEFTREAHLADDYREYTSVTKKILRIARFDSQVVKEAIVVNNPTEIFLNHMDYVEPTKMGHRSMQFVRSIEAAIERNIDLVGYGPADFRSVRPLHRTAQVGK